ncbi:MAG: hypothetical protein M3R25_04255, partial [Bacteroidota bacterium]|nr:hypothetical protein [Bacteroidota bacterium]
MPAQMHMQTPFINRFSRLILILLALFSGGDLIHAQQTVLYKDAEADYQSMIKEYDQGLYGRAARSAENFLTTYHDPLYRQLTEEAELLQLKSWLRMEHPGTIAQIMAFANVHTSDPIA